MQRAALPSLVFSRSPSGGRMRGRGPTTSGPQMPAPPEYRFVDGAGQARRRSPISPWWQLVRRSGAAGLVREAMANNLDLQMAVARVEEARARAGIAKSFLDPQVDGGATTASARRHGKRPGGTNDG